MASSAAIRASASVLTVVFILDVQVVELAPGVGPTAHFDGGAIGIQPVEPGEGVSLQCAVPAGQVLLGVLPRAA